jgi:cytochrome c
VKTEAVRIFYSVFIFLISLVLVACSSTATSSSITSQTSSAVASSIVSSTVSSSAAVSPASENTYGALAASGQIIYNKFAASCHGESGGGRSGPAIIGSNINLAKYNTAKGLLDYVSATMPLGAPGRLSHHEYLEVLCYLIVQNNYVSADTVFDEAELNNISLK